jgi:hypothetical protein
MLTAEPVETMGISFRSAENMTPVGGASHQNLLGTLSLPYSLASFTAFFKPFYNGFQLRLQDLDE